jgi:hypothetical protein
MPIFLAETYQDRMKPARLTAPRLVMESLEGNDEARTVLLDEYTKLIGSIPTKCGFSRDEAGHIFQAEEHQKPRQLISKLRLPRGKPIHMLIFEEPLRPYCDLAATLEIASGTIGFIRQRRRGPLRKRPLDMGLS